LTVPFNGNFAILNFFSKSKKKEIEIKIKEKRFFGQFASIGILISLSLPEKEKRKFVATKVAHF